MGRKFLHLFFFRQNAQKNVLVPTKNNNIYKKTSFVLKIFKFIRNSIAKLWKLCYDVTM